MPNKRFQYISIDQNSNPLWDALPKIQAAAGGGRSLDHYIEDIDSAFTRRGAKPGDDILELGRERLHRDGSKDWGAALFYPGFLGRESLDIRNVEPLVGCSLKSLAKQLDCSVEDLYDEFAVSDNFQLIGSSYAGDKDHHRVLGDLGVQETGRYIEGLMDIAEENIKAAFPEAKPRERINAWFGRERRLLTTLFEQLRDNNARLPELYREWLASHCSSRDIRIRLTSRLFTVTNTGGIPGFSVFRSFLNNYQAMADCYNAAIKETGSPIKTLQTDRGELPFFAIRNDHGRVVRTSLFLAEDALYCADANWALHRGNIEETLLNMRADGVFLSGKALLLVLLVRIGTAGRRLLLPYRGSEYMPTAYQFERNLKQEGLLTEPICPVTRVRFHFLNRLKECGKTRMVLPQYLRSFFNASEITAADFADAWEDVRVNAINEIEKMQAEEGRNRVQEQIAPELCREIRELEDKRRNLINEQDDREKASELWRSIKQLRRQLTRALLEYAVNLLHVRNLDYWDSRGAVYPWSVAVGGEDFYNKVLAKAEFYDESAD